MLVETNKVSLSTKERISRFVFPPLENKADLSNYELSVISKKSSRKAYPRILEFGAGLVTGMLVGIDGIESNSGKEVIAGAGISAASFIIGYVRLSRGLNHWWEAEHELADRTEKTEKERIIQEQITPLVMLSSINPVQIENV